MTALPHSLDLKWGTPFLASVFCFLPQLWFKLSFWFYDMSFPNIYLWTSSQFRVCVLAGFVTNMRQDLHIDDHVDVHETCVKHISSSFPISKSMSLLGTPTRFTSCLKDASYSNSLSSENDWHAQNPTNDQLYPGLADQPHSWLFNNLSVTLPHMPTSLFYPCISSNYARTSTKCLQ